MSTSSRIGRIIGYVSGFAICCLLLVRFGLMNDFVLALLLIQLIVMSAITLAARSPEDESA